MDLNNNLLQIERPIHEKVQINPGDQVCAIHKTGNLLYGTVNSNVQNWLYNELGWYVRWVNELDMNLELSGIKSSQVSDSKLIPTDRLIHKGCKVRSLPNEQGEIKHGACQSVIYQLDLRVVGTSTVIRGVNIDEFTHLKDYKQKSVVHYQGWLGVISKVERDVEIGNLKDPQESKWRPLDPLPLGIESPLIFKSLHGSSIEYIKNLKVSSVTVNWCYQIDLNYPDKPRNVFKADSFRRLQIVMENVSRDDTQFFELGSLGRYRVNDNSNFCSLNGWQQKIVKMYAPSMIDKINKDMPNQMMEIGDEVAVQSRISNQLRCELVVEIIHVTSTPYIQWQNGTTEIMRSSLDLEIVNDIFLNSTRHLVPGHFIYSSQLGYKSDDAYFVLLNEKDTTNGRKYVVRVLDTQVPGKVLKSETFIDCNPILELHKAKPHPKYQYFNGIYTIVVINQKVDDRESVRIGHVIGTNLDGKINVRCIDSGRNEWFWPANCAIYIVRKFDLDCVKSHITDNENDADPETKLRNIIESLKSKVELVWKNGSQSKANLEVSLSDFEMLYTSYQGLLESSELNVNVDFTAYTELKDYIQKEYERGCLYYKNNDRLTKLVLKAVRDLLRYAESILEELTSKMLLDEPAEEPVCGGSFAEDQGGSQDIFSKAVDILSTHPSNHKYANKSYETQHHKSFLKTVREELSKLNEMCANDEAKTEMGILTRCYEDRMDLLSVLIKGALGTPYADSLYLFDVNLPSTYPNIPPQFHFHSFKAGRLNPNLYEMGRVCVSLLGTWNGQQQSEKWTKDSDIEQILLSIKALILVKDPFHNEPGREADRYSETDAKRHNLEYNQNLMPGIIRMMINQITFGLEPWQEEIKIFYKHQIPIFIARWNKWLNVSSDSLLQPEEKPGFEIYPMHEGFVSRMNTSLTELQNVWNLKL